jgi:hypothetical protein
MSAGMVAQSRAVVANDIRAPMFAPPPVAFGASVPAFGGTHPMQRPAEKPGKSVTFENCTFGGGTTREMVRDAVLEAFEADDSAAGAAA